MLTLGGKTVSSPSYRVTKAAHLHIYIPLGVRIYIPIGVQRWAGRVTSTARRVGPSEKCVLTD